MHAEDVSVLAPPGIRDDEMHFVRAYEHRFLHLVLRVTPTGGPQFLKEVGWMLARLRPIEVLRPGEHDVRKVEFTVHSVCIARVEKSSEPIEAFRCSLDERTSGLIGFLWIHERGEIAHFT